MVLDVACKQKNKTKHPISSNSHPSATANKAIHCINRGGGGVTKPTGRRPPLSPGRILLQNICLFPHETISDENSKTFIKFIKETALTELLFPQISHYIGQTFTYCRCKIPSLNFYCH